MESIVILTKLDEVFGTCRSLEKAGTLAACHVKIGEFESGGLSGKLEDQHGRPQIGDGMSARFVTRENQGEGLSLTLILR